MIKRCLSILLMVIMVFTMLPTAVFAATTYEIWVGGIQVTTDNASGVTGEGIAGTVTYDAGTNTLTLNNATITGYYTNEFSHAAGIFAKYDINIVLQGSNSIDISPTIRVSGVTSDSGGVALSGDGILTINLGTSSQFSMGISSFSFTSTNSITGCTVTTTGGATTGSTNSSSIGISVFGPLLIEDATVIASGGSATWNSSLGILTESSLTVKDSSLTATGDTQALYHGGSISASDSTVTASSNKEGIGAAIVAVEDASSNTYMYVNITPGASSVEPVTLLVSSATANDDAARAEDATYKTFGGAITKAESGDTIKLITDITLASDQTITDKNIILDLNSFKLTRIYGLNVITLDGNSSLEVKDTSVAKTGELLTLYNYAIYNNGSGNVEISSGTVSSNTITIVNEGNGNVNISGGTVSSPDNHAIGNIGIGNVNIFGGAVRSTNAAAIRNTGNGEINVSGGTVLSVENRAIWSDGTGEVNISGGELSGREFVGAISSSVLNISGDPSFRVRLYDLGSKKMSITGPLTGVDGDIVLDGNILENTSAGTVVVTATSEAHAVVSKFSLINLDGKTLEKDGSSLILADSIEGISSTGIDWGTSITESIAGNTLTLSGEGEMYDFDIYEENKAKLSDLGINKVVIDEGITYVGHGAFHGNALSSVTLPSSLTEIGSMAFIVNALTEITIPESVTHIGYSAFLSNQLTSITIPNSVTNIGNGAFFNNQLESITMVRPDTDLEGYLLAQNNNNFKTAYEAGGAGTYTGTQAGIWTKVIPTNTTAYDTKVAEVDALVEAGYTPESWIAYEASIALAELTLTDLNTQAEIDAEVVKIQTALDLLVVKPSTGIVWGDNITENIEGDTLTLSGTGAMNDFTASENQNKLPDLGVTRVVIGEGITSVGLSAFVVNGLTSVEFPNSLLIIGRDSFNSNDLTSIEIPSNVTNINAFAFRDNNLTSITIPLSVVRLSDYSFYGNPITSITMERSDTEIGNKFLNSTNDYFRDAYTNIDAGGAGTYKGTPGGEWGKVGVVDTTLYDEKVAEVTALLEADYTPDSWSSYQTAIASVDLTLTSPNTKIAINAEVDKIQTALDLLVLKATTGINWGDSITESISSGTLTLSGTGDINDFGVSDNQNKLKDLFIDTVVIEDGITGIGGYAFTRNDLTSVIMADSVTTIKHYAFSWNSLTSVVLPESLSEIGTYAFFANDLTSITIPKNVANIYISAFPENNLTSITMMGAGATIGDFMLTNNASFRTAYTAGGAGTYTGTQTGTWTKDLTDTDKLAEAKTSIETELNSLAVSNATTYSDILTAATNATLHGVSVGWDSTSGFSKTNATSSAAGSITGILNLTLNSESGTVEVNKIIAQLPPVANDSEFNVAEGSTHNGAVTGTGDTLTYILQAGSQYGTVTFNADGSFTYMAHRQPTVGFVGNDSFTFLARDSANQDSNIATVTINITPVNDAPVAASKAITTTMGVETTGYVNATDVDGDALTYAVVTGPTYGTLTFNSDGSYSYTAHNSTETEDSFSFRANDGLADSANATVTITLVAPPLSDTEKIAEAKTSIENALNSLVVSNATTDSDILTAATGATLHGVSVVWDGTSGFSKTNATSTAAGSITGTLNLTLSEETNAVVVSKTITQLPLSDAEKVTLVKTAIETALGNLVVSNATTAQNILDAATGATLHGVSVVWDGTSGFSKTNATGTAAGSITGTLNLTLSGETNTVAVSKTIPKLPPTGGGSSGGSSTPATPQTPTNTIVTVNDEPVSAGTETKTTEDGKTTTLVQVNNEVIQRNIDEAVNNTADGAVNLIQIQVSDNNSENAIVELTGDIVKKLEENAFNVSVKNNDIEYIIPAKEFAISKVAETLNIQETDLKAITVDVRITKLDEQTIETYNEVAKLNGAELIFPPVSFEVVAQTTKNDGSTEEVKIRKFSNYVERVMEIPSGIDQSKVSTGVVFNSDGTYSHVPTEVFQKDGKWYARINSLTNSNYSVIWNPITVASVENHWSKDIVNDMASRLVIKNPETFVPNQNITRGEFAEYITKALGINRAGSIDDKKFTDVEVTHELAYAIEIASEYSIINGYPDGTFKPDAQISREEAMAMYSRAMDIAGLAEKGSDRINSYTDKDFIAEWAYNDVKKTISAGVFNGRTDKTINPKDTFTCAEAATAIRNLLVASDLINK